MRLPLIKEMVSFIEANDEDFIHETIQTLEYLSEGEAIKEGELDVIGELLSNFYGALEVKKKMDLGETQKEALNGFMKRVMGSIDK